MNRGIKINHDICTGCKSCEYACSFHHKKIFQPSIASIEVSIDEKERSIHITIYNDNHNGHIPCDHCKNETIPMCLRFCSIGAISLENQIV